MTRAPQTIEIMASSMMQLANQIHGSPMQHAMGPYFCTRPSTLPRCTLHISHLARANCTILIAFCVCLA